MVAVLVQTGERGRPLVGRGQRRLIDLLAVGKQRHGDALGPLAVPVVIVVPDLRDRDLGLLGLVGVRDGEAVCHVAAVHGLVIVLDLGFLDAVLDLLVAVVVDVEIGPGVAPVLRARQRDGIAQRDAVGEQLDFDALGPLAVLVVRVVPDLRDRDIAQRHAAVRKGDADLLALVDQLDAGAQVGAGLVVLARRRHDGGAAGAVRDGEGGDIGVGLLREDVTRANGQTVEPEDVSVLHAELAFGAAVDVGADGADVGVIVGAGGQTLEHDGKGKAHILVGRAARDGLLDEDVLHLLEDVRIGDGDVLAAVGGLDRGVQGIAARRAAGAADDFAAAVGVGDDVAGRPVAAVLTDLIGRAHGQIKEVRRFAVSEDEGDVGRAGGVGREAQALAGGSVVIGLVGDHALEDDGEGEADVVGVVVVSRDRLGDVQIHIDGRRRGREGVRAGEAEVLILLLDLAARRLVPRGGIARLLLLRDAEARADGDVVERDALAVREEDVAGAVDEGHAAELLRAADIVARQRDIEAEAVVHAAGDDLLDRDAAGLLRLRVQDGDDRRDLAGIGIGLDLEGRGLLAVEAVDRLLPDPVGDRVVVDVEGIGPGVALLHPELGLLVLFGGELGIEVYVLRDGGVLKLVPAGGLLCVTEMLDFFAVVNSLAAQLRVLDPAAGLSGIRPVAWIGNRVGSQRDGLQAGGPAQDIF